MCHFNYFVLYIYIYVYDNQLNFYSGMYNVTMLNKKDKHKANYNIKTYKEVQNIHDVLVKNVKHVLCV